jgi:hypothetical protein
VGFLQQEEKHRGFMEGKDIISLNEQLAVAVRRMEKKQRPWMEV